MNFFRRELLAGALRVMKYLGIPFELMKLNIIAVFPSKEILQKSIEQNAAMFSAGMS